MEQHMGAQRPPRSFARAHFPLSRVGVPFGHELLDHGDDFSDVGGGARFDIGFRDAKRRDVLGVFRGEAMGKLIDRLAGLRGGGVDLVVHVGDVANVFHLRIVHAQEPHENVEGHRWHGIADVRQVVDGGAAYIDAYFIRPQRNKELLAARLRVVEVDFHDVVRSQVGKPGA